MKFVAKSIFLAIVLLIAVVAATFAFAYLVGEILTFIAFGLGTSIWSLILAVAVIYIAAVAFLWITNKLCELYKVGTKTVKQTEDSRKED